MWIKTFLCFILCYISCYGLDRASQIHISYGRTYNSMVIMWSTTENVICYVEYYKSADEKHTQHSNVSALQYDYINAMKFIHRAELQELALGTVYHYKVVCVIGNDTSETVEHSFRTESGIADRPVKFLVFGDMGAHAGQPTIDLLNQEVTSSAYESVWHIGDMGYDLHSDNGAVGDLFLKKIEPIASRIPYMTSPGNHELRSSFHHYRTRFSMPGADWPMPIDKLWYSYDVGPVHFISFSSEVYFTNNQNYVCQQFYWLLEDLTKANQNRHVRPWIVAMGHRPMYCSNSDGDDCTGRIFGYMVKYGLEDLFHAQGVDLIIQAHEHSYERMWPVYRDKVLATNYNNPPAPVHIISGAAGCGEGVDPVGTPDPWSAFVSDIGSEHSYGRLHVQNYTHLYFEQIRVKDSSVLDSVWIVQHNHGPNVKDLNCSKSNDDRHFSCYCPPPFHFITVIIFAAVSLGSLLILGGFCCFMCWKNKYKQGKAHRNPCCSKVCRWCRRSSHSLLLNEDDADDNDVELVI